MVYSDFYLKDRVKIPTSLGVVLVLLIAFSFSRILLFNGPNTKASAKTVKRLELTNPSPFQVNLFWQTDNKDEGWVSYGENESANEKIVLDDRDIANSKTKFFNHYATIRDLKAGHQYFFVIATSDGLIYDTNHKPFSFKTPATSSVSQALKPANGKVLRTNQSPENNAVILLTVDGYYPLSVLTKDDGSWVISLNSFYNTSKSESISLSDTQMARVEILNEDNQKCTLNETFTQLFVSNTVIIGGANDVCGSLQAKAPPSTSTVLSASTHLEIPQKQVDIIYPIEGSLIPGRNPIIKGIAVPNTKVSISIHSQKTYSAVVTAGIDGKFDYLIPDDLQLGPHQIIIKTKDAKGNDVTVIRNFVIVANSGEGKVLGVASGEPTITATPLPTLLPTSTTSATLAPTTPVTGNVNYVPILGGLSFIMAGLGFIIVF